jgi:adhesin transport system outer membrane protein
MCLLGVALLMAAAPVQAQGLTDELSDLVRSHPQIQSKTKSVAASEEGIGVARAGYYPTVRLSGDSGPEYVDSQDRRTTQRKSFERGRETTGLVVTQHLFDGYATDGAVDAAKVTRDISGVDLRSTRQTVVLEAITAYISVLKAKRLVALAGESERMVKDQMNLEDERVEKGSGIASDVLAAKQRLQLAKEARVRYEGDLATAVAKYSQVFGHRPEPEVMDDPPVPLDLVAGTVDSITQVAEKENPSVEMASRTIELADRKVDIAQSGYYPTIDLVGRADYENGKAGVTGYRKDWSILVTATWDLFSGFKTQSATAQAAMEHAASRDNHLYSLRKVQEQTRIAWHKLSNARERLGLLDNAASLAEEVWEAMRKRQEAGKATVQNVLDEETRINEARINYTTAYYDMMTATYELLGAMGRLEVENLAGVPANGTIKPPSKLLKSTAEEMAAKRSLSLTGSGR